MSKIYKPINIVNYSLQFGLLGGVAVGAIALLQPWTLVVSAVLTGGLLYGFTKVQAKHLENNLQKHPEGMPESPNFGKISEGLYKAAGLKADQYPIYDFKESQTSKSKGFIKDIFNQMALTHNAAATNLNKPVIMVSKPLLQLLNEEETKAVLAHEFMHASANHTKMNMVHQWISGGVSFASSITQTLVEFATLGIGGYIATAIGKFSFDHAYANAAGGKGIMGKKTEDLTFADLARKKNIETDQAMLGVGINAAILALVAPPAAAVWGVCHAIKLASKYLSSSLARRMEFQADRGAADLGANPLALITGLRKIETAQKEGIEIACAGQPMPKKGFLRKAWETALRSHPVSDRRIARLANIARKAGYSEADIKLAVERPISTPKDMLLSPEVLKRMAI